MSGQDQVNDKLGPTQRAGGREGEAYVVPNVARIPAFDELGAEAFGCGKIGHGGVVAGSRPVPKLHPPLRVRRIRIAGHVGKFSVPPPHGDLVGYSMAKTCASAQE